MSLKCCNKGGPATRLVLPLVPDAETPIPVTADLFAQFESWQVRPGDILSFVDPCQSHWRGRVEQDGDRWLVVPFQPSSHLPESPVQVDLFQALPQRERFELILEKATELGVRRIIPYQSDRSITLQERDARQRKSHRWPDMVLRAARQCRRLEIPELFETCSWDEALYFGQHAELKLLLFEGESAWSMAELLVRDRPLRVALLIGPEGGFTSTEIEDACQLGFLPVSLGPRLLRTETAAIAAVAVAQACIGDIA